MSSCGGCEQTPVVLCCDILGWWWCGSEERGHAVISQLTSCSAPVPSLKSICSCRLPWGVLFCAWESCRGLACTCHTMQTGCCLQKRGFRPSHSALDKEEGQLQGQLNLSCWYRIICSRSCTIKTPSANYHFGSDVIVPDTVRTRPQHILWRSVIPTHSDLQRH